MAVTHTSRGLRQVINPQVLPISGPGRDIPAIEVGSIDAFLRDLPQAADKGSGSTADAVLEGHPPASIEDFCKNRAALFAKVEEAGALGITSFQVTPDRPLNIPTGLDGPLVIMLTQIGEVGVENIQGRNIRSPLIKFFDIFLPGETIALKPSTSAKVTAIWINPVAVDVIAELSNIENWNSLASVRAATDKCVFRIFKTIVKFISGEGVGSGEKAFYAATLMTSYVLRHYSVKSTRHVSSPFSAKFPEIVASIKADIGETLLTSKLARQFGMRECELNDLFAAEAGCTPYQFIIKQRIELAAQMLTDPAISITSIAYDCGFGSHAHLTTTFKNRMGVTPSSYRKSYQQSVEIDSQSPPLVDNTAGHGAEQPSLG